jgi:ribosomal protein L16 Arg81 hydroxylase
MDDTNNDASQTAAMDEANDKNNESRVLHSILKNKMTSADFFRHVWQQKAAHFPFEGISKPLSPSEVGSSWRNDVMKERPFDEIRRNGWHILQDILQRAQLQKDHTKEHKHPLIFQNRELQSPQKIKTLYGNSLFTPYLDGCSVVLNHGDLLSPWIASLSQDLQKEFPHVYANCYLTPPDSQAVSPHADDRDVLVLQLVGSKQWKVYQRVPVPYPYPHEQVGKDKVPVPQSVLDGPLCIDKTLQPGDVLYMPRGFVHEAHSPPNELSFHITIALATHDWSLAGMISMETERLMTQVIDYRRSVLPCGDPKDLQTQLDRAMDMLKEKITVESITVKLKRRLDNHNQRAFGSRMKLIQNARFPPVQEDIQSITGPIVATMITYTSVIRAATPEERSSVSTEDGSPRGLNVREEIADSIYAIIRTLKSDSSIKCPVVGLRNLLPGENHRVCDLALLSLAKRAVELGAFAVVNF